MMLMTPSKPKGVFSNFVFCTYSKMEIDAIVSMSDLALSCKCKICGIACCFTLFIWTDASFGHTCSVWNRTGLVVCSAESCMELASEG